MWPCTMKRVDAVLSSSCTEDPSGKLVLGSAFHVQHMLFVMFFSQIVGLHMLFYILGK